MWIGMKQIGLLQYPSRDLSRLCSYAAIKPPKISAPCLAKADMDMIKYMRTDGKQLTR